MAFDMTVLANLAQRFRRSSGGNLTIETYAKDTNTVVDSFNFTNTPHSYPTDTVQKIADVRLAFAAGASSSFLGSFTATTQPLALAALNAAYPPTAALVQSGATATTVSTSDGISLARTATMVGGGAVWFDATSAVISGALNSPIQFRASRSLSVYGNAGIIDRMMADKEVWHLWCFGDSRTSGIITSQFALRAPSGIPLAGMQMTSNTNAGAGFNIGRAAASSGDGIAVSPYIGYVADPFTVIEAQTSAGATNPANNTLSNRITYTGDAWTFSQNAGLAGRLSARQVRARTLVRRNSNAWSTALTSPASSTPTMPNVYLQVRQNGSNGAADIGYYKSSRLGIYSGDLADYVINGVTIPAGLNWTTYSQPSLEHVVDPSITIGQTGKVFSMSPPWLELPTGILMHEVGCVAGRSVAAFNNEEITPVGTFTKVAKTVGGRHALWAAIGTNNPENMTTAQFQSVLTAFIEKARALDPFLPVILTTSYPANSDGGAEPYYVQAIRNIAALDGNVVAIDTYATLPTYAAGSSAGLYSDVTHYNATGQAAYADKYWQLWLAA